MFRYSSDSDSEGYYEDEYGWSSENDEFYESHGITKRARLELLPRKVIPKTTRAVKDKSPFYNPERDKLFASITRDVILRYSSYSYFTRGESLYDINCVQNVMLRGTRISAKVIDDEVPGTPATLDVTFDESGTGVVSYYCTCKEASQGSNPLWCPHVVATLMLCMKEPQVIHDYFYTKKILSELSKEDLVVILLNKMVDTPEFMVHLVSETKWGKPMELSVLSPSIEQALLRQQPVIYPFDTTHTVSKTKEYVSTTLKEDIPVDDWAVTRLISNSFTGEAVWTVTDACPCGFCGGHPLGSFNRLKGIIKELVDVVTKFWTEGEVHNAFRCLSKSARVLSMRANNRNICDSFKEACRKILYLWINYLVGCPLPVADRLAWTNELTSFSFGTNQELKTLLADALHVGKVGWDEKELNEVMSGHMEANYQESPVVIAARLRVLDHQRYFEELQHLGKFAAHKYLGKLENPAELHDMATAVVKAMPHAAFLFGFKRFMVSKQSEGKQTDTASELKDSGKALIEITCENLAISKHDRANRDDQDTPSLVELCAAKVAHVLIINNDYENLVDTLESVPLNIQKVLMLELGKQMIVSISAQLAFECAKIFSAASEHKAALQLALAGIKSPASYIDNTEYTWVMKLASEMGPNTYRMIANSVAKKCTDPDMLWQYCQQEMASSRWLSATSFFVSSNKHSLPYYTPKKDIVDAFFAKIKGIPKKSQEEVLRQVLRESQHLDYLALRAAAETADEFDKDLALELAVKAMTVSKATLVIPEGNKEKKGFMESFAKVAVNLGHPKKSAELYLYFFIKEEHTIEAFLQAKNICEPYQDLLDALYMNLYLIPQTDKLISLFINQKMYKDITKLYNRGSNPGQFLMIFLDELERLPDEQANQVWSETYESLSKSIDMFHDASPALIEKLSKFNRTRVYEWITTFLLWIARVGFTASDKNYSRFVNWMSFTRDFFRQSENSKLWAGFYESIVQEPSIRRKGKLLNMLVYLKQA